MCRVPMVCDVPARHAAGRLESWLEEHTCRICSMAAAAAASARVDEGGRQRSTPSCRPSRGPAALSPLMAMQRNANWRTASTRACMTWGGVAGSHYVPPLDGLWPKRLDCLRLSDTWGASTAPLRLARANFSLKSWDEPHSPFPPAARPPRVRWGARDAAEVASPSGNAPRSTRRPAAHAASAHRSPLTSAACFLPTAASPVTSVNAASAV